MRSEAVSKNRPADLINIVLYERTTHPGRRRRRGDRPLVVLRYFGSKEQLFDAALTVGLRLPDWTAVTPQELPRLPIDTFLDRREDDPGLDTPLVLLRSAVTNERAAERVRETFAEQVAPGSSPSSAPRRRSAAEACSPPNCWAWPAPATCCACPASPRSATRRSPPSTPPRSARR